MRARCDESTSSQVKVSHGAMFMPTAEPHTVNVNRAIKRRTECFLSARQHLSEAVSEVAPSAAASEGLAVRSCVCVGSAGPSQSQLTSLKHPETKAAAASHHEHANGDTGVCGDWLTAASAGHQRNCGTGGLFQAGFLETKIIFVLAVELEKHARAPPR